MKKRRRPLALDYLIYVAIRLTVAVAQALSVEQSYALADALAALAYRLDRRHRLVALENLRHALGAGTTEADRDRIVRGVYRHFFRTIVEMLHIPRKLHPTTWRRYVALTGHERVLERLLRGGPIVMVTGHFGNWELTGYVFGVFGFPPVAIARTLDNPYLDRFLRTFRERTGGRLIPKKGGMDQSLDVLQAGRVLGVIADQDAGPKGQFVEFFGRPASTHKGIALMAIEYRAPIIVGFARRVGPGFRFEIGCTDLIEPEDWEDRADAVRYVTQRFTAGIEEFVRRDPDQYLWLHRRWKHQPKPKGPHLKTTAPVARPAL